MPVVTDLYMNKNYLRYVLNVHPNPVSRLVPLTSIFSQTDSTYVGSAAASKDTAVLP